MKLIRVMLFCIAYCVFIPAMAQGVDDIKGKREVLQMGLYPPDIIMMHQQRLGITDAQRSRISKAVQKFQGEVAQLQWTLQNDQQQLRQYFSVYPIATDKSLAQAERVLGLESQFKMAHFRLLVAIKNELTEDQIRMIDKVIAQKRERRAS